MHNLSLHFQRHPEEFISVKDAAALLRQTPGAIREKVRQHKLHGVKVGGSVWIWRPSLDDFIVTY